MNKGKSSLATRMYRFDNFLYNKKIPLLPQLMDRVTRVLFSCDIPSQTHIGYGTEFLHNGLGIVIHPGAQIGKYNKIMQNVTIGGRNGQGAPTIGDYCFIGSGACVLGEIKIGDNVMIGANAVVLKDIPDNVVVAGVPAKIINRVSDELLNVYKN